MPFLIGPESVRARWAKQLPADVVAGLPVVEPIAAIAVGQVVGWRVDRTDFLMLGGPAPVRATGSAAGVVFVRSPSGAAPSGAKWKARTDTELLVREPIALFATDGVAEPTPLALAHGIYEVAIAPDLVRIKLRPGSELELKKKKPIGNSARKTGKRKKGKPTANKKAPKTKKKR